jgi:hypothetical protein
LEFQSTRDTAVNLYCPVNRGLFQASSPSAISEF